MYFAAVASQTVRDWIQATAYFVGIAAAAISALQYLKNSQRERSRWLFEQYLRFYSNPILKEMAERIDWGETRFTKDESQRELWGKLDEYLNFFEFIAYLRTKEQLRPDEIEYMFDYPLQQIASDKNVAQYFMRKGYSYSGLAGLLRDLGYAKEYGPEET
jgi:hypothetical protein